ncbi:unnamed protein product [Paramecium sonneborni]|uniref:non-specific serine/threonine protein kinase n=1 Tax=Paramecium sonneborni TaxID=65129 RepID=A0A8S1QXK0_9CILI|nr:unnamed protein product [Paramecium sonneborni]
MFLIISIFFLTFAKDSPDPNDAFLNQSIAVVLGGQQKHYYDNNIVVHSSTTNYENKYQDVPSNYFDDDDETSDFVEQLSPYDYNQEIDLNDLRVSRIYQNVNKKEIMPLIIPEGNMSNYAVKKYLGDGTFAFVQSGIRLTDGIGVVLKQIKSKYLWWARMEAHIIDQLNEEKNVSVVRLIDMYMNNTSPVLVFQELQNSKTLDYRIYSLYHDLNLEEIKRFYLQLFYGLYVSHKKGIMHLDIKPSNIIVSDDEIQIIDWGVSDFYYPLKEYRTRVGTRHYRAPEQLIHYKNYDYAVDVWALGSILASTIFKKYPFFKGKNNDDQLLQVVRVLGSKDFFMFCEKYNIKIGQELQRRLEGYERKALESYINEENRELVSPEVIDLLNKIFVYDHRMRISAEEIVQHEFFRR